MMRMAVQGPAGRAFISEELSAGTMLLSISMYPKAQPTAAPPACNNTRAAHQPVLNTPNIHIHTHTLKSQHKCLVESLTPHLFLERDRGKGALIETIALC